MSTKQILFRWLPSFLAFPVAGQIVVWMIGPVQDLVSATIAGLVLGLVVGFSQSWALKPIGVSTPWAIASAVALTVASPIAWAAVAFETTISSLSLWGLISGVILGLAQALSQRLASPKVLLWATSVGATWALAWFTSANVIVDADANYAVFGSTGALLATSILGFLLNPLFQKAK